MATEVIKADHKQFSQIEPTHKGGMLGQIMAGKSPLSRLTARLYDIAQYQLPMTPEEFDAAFPGEIRLFTLDQPQACPGRQTNLSRGTTVETPFLMMGFGILATAEGQGFALTGVMKNVVASGGPTPCVTGCTGALDEHNAVLAWGYPTWNIIEKFFQAYRVSMFIGRHFQIFEEAAHVMGLVGATMEFVGSGNSLISTTPFNRDVNDVLVAKGCNKQFIPQNTAAGSECMPAPTAEAMWGSQHTKGISNRCYPLPFPILWLPGMTIDVRFTRVEGDCCFFPAMRRDAVLDCASPTLPSSQFTDTLECGSGNAGIYTVPGGCFTIGAVLAGYDLVPAACVEYLAGVTSGSALEMLYQQVGIGSYLTSKLIANRGALNGLPEDVKKQFDNLLASAK